MGLRAYKCHLLMSFELALSPNRWARLRFASIRRLLISEPKGIIGCRGSQKLATVSLRTTLVGQTLKDFVKGSRDKKVVYK